MKIKEFFEKQKYLIATILIASCIYLFYLMASKIYPFGETSLMISDMAGQYVPFWEYFRNCFFGNESIFYSFAKGIGGNMIGIWTYYLMSPCNLLFLLFSKSMITETVVIVAGLKFVLCSVTMHWYLKEKIENKFIVILLSLSYAFCGYNAAYQINLMWLDNVMLLPLIILGVEKLVRENKGKMYAITLALSIIFNFYVGYATALLAGLYFIYDNFMQKIEMKKILIRCFKFAFYSLLAIGMASVVIFPALFMLKTGKGASMQLDFATMFTRNYKEFDILAKLFMGTMNGGQVFNGLPNIYTGLFTLLLAEIYFFNKNVPIKKKILSLLLIGALLASFNINILNLLWHGLKTPIGFLYRYSFVFSFVLVAIASNGLTEGKKQKITWPRWVCIFLLNLGMLFYVYHQNYEFVQEKVLIISAILLFFYAMMIGVFLKTKSNKILGLMILVTILELVMNTTITFTGLKHEKREKYMGSIATYDAVVPMVREYDDGFYRMEKNDNFYLNDSLLFGYNGVGHSSSTFEQAQVDLLKNIGYDWYLYFPSYGYGNTILTDSLFGIKYKISKEERKDYFTYIKDLEKDYQLYQNNYELSIGYLTDQKVEEMDSEEKNPFTLQTQLWNSITNSNSTYFKEIPVKEIQLHNVEKEGDYYQKKEGESYIEVTYDISKCKEKLYFWLDTVYGYDETGFKMYLNNKDSRPYIGANRNGVIDVDCSDDTVTIKLEFLVDFKFPIHGFILKEFEKENFEQAYNKIKENQFENIHYQNNTLEGTISVPEGEKYLFTTISYDEGWTAYVDGKETEIENTNNLITLKLEEGNHQLKFSYQPKGFSIGLKITILSILILVGVEWVLKRKKGIHS